MNADEYQKLALVTENTPELFDFQSNHMDRLTHALLGLCTEAGEAQDALKRFLIYGKDLDHANILQGPRVQGQAPRSLPGDGRAAARGDSAACSWPWKA